MTAAQFLLVVFFLPLDVSLQPREAKLTINSN